MDYGNQEVLLYNTLRRLDPKFFQLPCQAIICDLFNALPADPSGTWTDEVCAWFTDVILGTSLRVSITSCSAPNVVSLEVFLPTHQLMNSVVANFNLRSKDFDQDFVALTTFMQHVGLSKSADCPSHLSVSDASSIQKTHKELSCSNISDLPPLVVKLDELNQFTCLMSVVSKDMLLYVHPAQVSVAHSITVLDEILQSHYSAEENRVALPTGYVKSGSLCALYSREFQEWCRAVIVAVHGDFSSGDKLSCLVFFLDHGGSLWEESSQLFTLAPALCIYPALVICCDLTGYKDRGIDEGSPRVNFEVSTTSYCSTKLEKLALECADSVSAVIENKPLIAVVKVEKGNVHFLLLISSCFGSIRLKMF